MVELSLSADELDRRRERITTFISEQVAAANVDGAVLGLSGGIDSTLVAYLAVDALGSDAVFGVSLPAAVSGERNRSDAARVAEHLDIPFEEREIEPAVTAIRECSPLAEVGEEPVGNARARVRAVVSYLIANETNRLVLGTGNRSEALIGYFTKYGDGAVDCHPIGNLYKHQVRQLARTVGVPEDIIEKPPTAELWTGQTDEAELGLDYDRLDRILALHVDGPLSVTATADTLDCDPATVERVAAMVSSSEHKRRVPPTP